MTVVTTACLLSGRLAGVTEPAGTYLVAPFQNVGGDRTLDWIGEAISETATDSLAEAGVFVVSRGELAEGFSASGVRNPGKLSRASLIRIAERLDADVVVLGQFEFVPREDAKSGRTAGQLRIQARLVRTGDVEQSATLSLTGTLGDLARILNELCYELIAQAAPKSAGSRDAYLAAHPVVRVETLEAYVRGLQAPPGAAKNRYFASAAKLEPGFGKAALELGLIAYRSGRYGEASSWLAQVPVTIRRGREALFFLGLARYGSGDFAGAQAAFERLSRDVPLNEVWNNLGVSLSRIGHQDAEEALRKAREGDPNDADYAFNLGYVLLRQGRFSEAAEQFRAGLQSAPDDSEILGMLQQSELGAAIGTLRTRAPERIKEVFNESAYWQLRALIGQPRQ
jgi:tetratricopeptide (TPR) repeat protein